MNTKQKEKISINKIESTVISDLNSFWQTLDSSNDQGIDGIIFIGKKGFQTGKFIYVQAKTGISYKHKDDDNELILKFDKQKLIKWKTIWQSKIEPVIMIYVDEHQIYWTNLKETVNINDNKIIFNKTNKFNSQSRSALIKLCGHKSKDKNLVTIKIDEKDRLYLYENIPLKKSSHAYYNDLKKQNSINYANSYFNDLKFSRVGWNHINHCARGNAKIRMSRELLCTIKPIFENVKKFDYLKTKKRTNNSISMYLGIRASIKFKQKDPIIVQIIILCKREFLGDGTYIDKKWFLSIHELIKLK